MVNFINPTAEALTGWSMAEATNRPLAEVFKIINENTREPVESPVTKVIREGTVIGLANHTVLLTKDGKEIPIADSGAPIKVAGGKVVGVILVFRDVTEEKRAEEARS
jgi:PAS domain S-box-containing protein